jgi:hypothetical protein
MTTNPEDLQEADCRYYQRDLHVSPEWKPITHWQYIVRQGMAEAQPVAWNGVTFAKVDPFPQPPPPTAQDFADMWAKIKWKKPNA